ncbi:phosphoribosylamine--glycine ligase [Staphylospora marina]|uniref:phosphoribosylamine--glycine ligase n=1 Tax=Staphylospora marina TaxID=2490858 RepID=UPI000F5BD4FE|nr:phosphoribosylamine--glycine ligase [Staphylospora marina]
MRVLVVGGGGREHAIVWKLAQSPDVEKIWCAPGNGGIAELAECVPIQAHDVEALLEFALERNVDLTVVGPEDPLMRGIVNRFQEHGLHIFGPTAEGAKIEGSKRFAKELMQKYGIPTAKFRVFSDADEAKAYLREQGVPIVVKADGLAAGKGVVVARTMEEAERAVEDAMVRKVFGEAGAEVVIEECLEGQELSLMAFFDGHRVVPMVPAQDHKPVFDGDRGPNTGGMGTYSPVPQIPEDVIRRAEEEILRPMQHVFESEGILYRGVLYAGLMWTADGPKVIEFNARFGDPETQVVLPRLDGDLARILLDVSTGRLRPDDVKWKSEAAVCVVMAAGGYPGPVEKGRVIEGLPAAERPDVIVFHAGTARENGQLVTAGGRVLGVTALGSGLREARDKAYETVRSIRFAGAHYRSDIAFRALET